MRMLGIALSIVALGYFAIHAKDALSGQDLARLLEPHLLATGLLLVALYMLLIPVTGLAWSWLLEGTGSRIAPYRATTILATTQFGKYLPGNVAHHLGRVVIARAQGVGTHAIMLSMTYETVLVVVACAHISALTLLWSLPKKMASWPLLEYRGAVVAAISLLALAALWAAPRLVRLATRLRARSISDEPRMLTPNRRTLLACYFLYGVNFILIGVGLFGVTWALVPNVELRTLLLLTGAFAASWIIGFLAPGAPAGLGVREAALAMWLDDALGVSTSVLLIVALRLATTAGDLLNFAWGTFALKRYPAR